MRKCLMLLGAAMLLSLIPAVSAEAQSRRAAGFAMAPNRSKLRVDGETGGGWRWGWQGGGYVQQPVAANGLVSVRLEGWYMQKGEENFGGVVNSSIRINYIEFPLLLVVGTPFDRRSAMRISAYAGGTFAVRVSCNITVASGIDVESGNCSSFDADVSGTDYGLLGGASLGLRNFFIDFRYDYGLKDILNNSDTSVKNVSYALSFGVIMPIGN